VTELTVTVNKEQVEQVYVTKLLGVTLDCKLSMVKTYDTTVANMGRSLHIIKRYSNFLTALSTRQVLQSCGQVPQRGTQENWNRLRTGHHGWPLNVHGTNNNNMHVNLSWLTVEERLTASPLVIVFTIEKHFGNKHFN
jgi:hypothetical protein